jgi:hypothetical protein
MAVPFAFFHPLFQTKRRDEIPSYLEYPSYMGKNEYSSGGELVFLISAKKSLVISFARVSAGSLDRTISRLLPPEWNIFENFSNDLAACVFFYGP